MKRILLALVSMCVAATVAYATNTFLRDDGTFATPPGGGGSGTVGSGTTGQLAVYPAAGTVVQGASTFSISGAIGTTATTASSSTGTGAITDAGGLGVAGQSYLGAATGKWFLNDSPPGNINYINDRIFLGGATLNNGNSTGTLSGDWFSTFQNAIGEGFGYIGNAQLASITGTNPFSAYGMLGASESLNFTSGVSTIGLVGVAVNNNTAHTTIGFGIYSECHQRTGAFFIGCFANEADPRTEVATNQPDPFSNAVIVGYQSACGAGVASTGHPCGAAYQVVANPETYNVGINFESGSVTAGGAGGNTAAISLPAGYQILWYSSPGTIVGSLGVDSSGNMIINISGSLKVNGTVVNVP